MNILIDKLPDIVDVDGTKYRINSDFRTAIKFEIMVEEYQNKEQGELIANSLRLFFDIIPQNTEKAIEQIICFYSCGKKDGNTDTAQDSYGDNQRVYSFTHDADYIYSAFFEQYGIDLQIAKLHWWQFRKLFRCLSEDCLMSKIIYYRNVKITSDMPKGEKERIRKLKQLYALPLVKSEQESLGAIEKALMGDGNLDGIL